MNNKVSIIIPSYNRSQLLGATLDSILAQTYRHWECIVVDDGSTDYTEELMEFYCAKDSRIKFFARPENRRKGANACRNYGFEKSRGEYIQWFDSDDLMVPHFLECKLNAIQNSKADYVISKTANFRDPNPENILSRNEKYYRFDEFEINNFNYVTQKINWLTYDLLVKKNKIDNIRFNEKLQSAQERNFFSKLTALSTNAFIIDEYLTYRRIHKDSTQFKLKKNRSAHKRSYFDYCYETYIELKKIKNGPATHFLFKEALEYTMNRKVSFDVVLYLSKELFFLYKFASLWYLLYHLSIKILDKGYLFRKKFRKSWHPDIQKENIFLKVREELLGKKQKSLINILTRTSNRPNYFRKCRDSIADQSYKYFNHIVSYDDGQDLDYILGYDVNAVDVSHLKYENTEELKSYNLYCNSLLESVNSGWVLFLDDDNILKNKNTLEILVSQIKFIDEDTLVVFQTEFPDHSKIPQSYYFKRRNIEKYQIDTACVLFHSKYASLVQWDNKRMADYRFIKRISEIIPKQKWIEMVMTKKLNFGDSGNRNDIQ